jgi:outer membrane protein
MGLPNYGALGELNPLNSSLGFGVSVSLPLFDNFSTGASIAAADASAASAERQARAGRLAVEREVRAGLIDLVNAHRQLLLAGRSLALSRERLELAREQYRVGALDYLMLQTVMDRAAAAEGADLDARFAFASALIALEKSVGAPVHP